MGASPALSNILLLVFALIPVSSLLAGQINYDNLFIPLVGLLMLWVVEFDVKLKATKAADSQILIKIAALGLFGSLVKYAYLPFFVAGVIYIVLSLVWNYRLDIKKFGADLINSFKIIDARTKWLLIIVSALLLLLCGERYGVNMARYKTPVPDCGQVMSYNECKEFGPWIRDFDPHPASYFWHDWLYGMWFRLFFMVDGPDTQFQTRGPLTLPAFTFIGVVVAVVAAGIFMATKLWRAYGFRIGIPLFMSVFYALVLWTNGYSSFSKTGKPVAINGRYLLPVLLPFLAVGMIAITLILKKNDRLKVVLASLMLLAFIWGGGILTFILRSNDAWYWNNSAVKTVNNSTRNLIGPIVPGYEKPTQYQR